jgi:glycosyltransferase involved in cell wall biosynthesis
VNFVFSGTLGKLQAMDVVVRAFKEASDQGSKAFLTVIGDGSEMGRLRNIVHDLGATNIRFVGRIDMKNVLSWLTGSDVLVLPLAANRSVQLTLPAKFQAYLAAQKPILAVARGAIAELVEDNDLGWVADPDSVDSVVDAIRLAERMDPDRVEAMKQRMAGLLENQFDRAKTISLLTSYIVDEAPRDARAGRS